MAGLDQIEFFDDEDSWGYVPPAVRVFWKSLLLVVGAVVVFAGFPGTVKVILAAAWTLPSLVYNGMLGFRQIASHHKRLRAARLLDALPPPGSSSQDRMTRLLLRACIQLEAQDTGSHELRLTLFRPDLDLEELHQVARYEWNGAMAVSNTRFSFDEGLVGWSYSEKRDFAIANIDAVPESVKGLMKHSKQEIRSLLVTAITNDDAQCVAVLCIDSTTPNFFDSTRRSLGCIDKVAAGIEELIALDFDDE